MYDLIIIGGGPCGSAAGRIAGKKGLKTLLIEKEIFPRYKPCGGALSEHAMSYLDFEIPESMIERDIFGARAHFKGQVVEQHKDSRIAVLITRSILDNYLLEKAGETGIEIKMGEKVLEYQEKNDCVEVFTDNDTYKAKFIIIAEGSQGKLKYQIRRKDRNDEYAIGVVAEIEADNESIDKYIHNVIDLHFGRFKHGYGWIFPHDKYYSVGIAGLAKHLPHPKKTMLDFLNENNFNNKYKLHGHIIPAGGIKRKITSSRVILSGDSAGFVDSFIGEGIAYAIRSGQIAVEVISKIILDDDDLKTIKNYEIICRSEFINNLNYSLIFVKLINSCPSIFLKILVSNEAIEKYLEVTTMEISYKSYIKWLIPRIPMFLLRS
ncbi:MAG: geranylgeranyl reductase family protein [ANME-2 cluster archaeon]|nr:geranylgeranyl reductase family protein [ANME-2 cluster archaeon]MBC2702315.1 geranylgeranyl reductase family protein [ANME-2 cluster archaeon]MBC2707514.1 geranylgeranyl reductase family protein [ANME-2 cluster archaeon]MBC2748149.1 geranylgeranyl reductase family protein [ANME-2 cluster archaeon]MBC2762487.1 geranylgeranyl reductase family protein [ANME-2 cluster archaeon]